MPRACHARDARGGNKVEPPGDGRRAGRRWARRIRRGGGASSRMHRVPRVLHRDDAAPGPMPAACGRRHALLCVVRGRRHGAVPEGLRPVLLHCFYRQFWSGSRTRDYRFMRPMLYPTELSSGAACRIRTCDPRLRRPVLSPLSQCRNRGNHFAPASAYATAAPRAPDGTRARSAVASRHGFRIAVYRKAAIRGRSAARRRHAGCMELLSRTPETRSPRHGVRGHSLSLGRSG